MAHKPKLQHLPLSLCMIVKDEEDWIEQCLQSVASIVSEIIVVDTGSNDKTVELARKNGAQVFEFPWNDDFAAARNFSLAKATGEWILVLDADEMIASDDLPRFEKLLRDRSVCTEFLQRHYCDDPRISNFKPLAGEFPQIERGYLGYFESNCCRLFPNGERLTFRGRIHELVEQSIKESLRFKIHRTDIRIHHFGHSLAVKNKKDKSKLYRALGEQKASDAPLDWKALYELGVEYNCSGKLHESVEAFVKSIELKNDYLDTWVNLGYVFCELGLHEEGEKALLHALKLRPNSSEALCNLGVINLRQSKHREAEVFLKRAIAVNPHYLNALCNLGKVLAAQGRLAEAACAYLDAIGFAPNCGPALLDLASLHAHVGKREEAISYLKKAEVHAPVTEQAKVQLAELRQSLNLRN